MQGQSNRQALVKSVFEAIFTAGGRWFGPSRYIGQVTPKNRYFSIIFKSFLDQSIQKTVYFILKTKPLPVAYLGVLSGHDASEELESRILRHDVLHAVARITTSQSNHLHSGSIPATLEGGVSLFSSVAEQSKRVSFLLYSTSFFKITGIPR